MFELVPTTESPYGCRAHSGAEAESWTSLHNLPNREEEVRWGQAGLWSMSYACVGVWIRLNSSYQLVFERVGQTMTCQDCVLKVKLILSLGLKR